MKPEGIRENFKRCVCGECSVYTDCCREKNEKLFCGRTNSTCEMRQNQMCNCGNCTVYFENNLDGGYYCAKEFKE